jgi:hypothetical protein
MNQILILCNASLYWPSGDFGESGLVKSLAWEICVSSRNTRNRLKVDVSPVNLNVFIYVGSGAIENCLGGVCVTVILYP